MKIKVELEPGQSPDAAEEELYKALSGQRSGAAHEDDHFSDPAMEHMVQIMGTIQETVYLNMLNEISAVLSEEPL